MFIEINCIIKGIIITEGIRGQSENKRINKSMKLTIGNINYEKGSKIQTVIIINDEEHSCNLWQLLRVGGIS